MASPTRPGVEIEQEIQQTPAVSASPTLVPMIVGVCNQIIEALDSEGALNPDAKFSGQQYNQASVLVTQAEFPDPRDNIDEINVDEGTVEAFLFFGGQLQQLPRGSHGTVGRAFLKAQNLSRRAAIRSTVADSFTFDATVGDVLTLAFNVVNSVDTSRDVTVTLLGTLTTQEVADEINDAVGEDVASVFEDTDGDFGPAGAKYLQLESLISGATSSITLRQGTGAMKSIWGASFDDAADYRVEGAGFRGQDDLDDDLSTPFVEFYQGAYRKLGVDTTFPADNTANSLWAGLIDLDDVFTNAKAAAVIFSGPSATIPLVAATSSVPGDQFWADGVQVGSAEIIKLEPSRFKLGRLNTSLSVFDDNGVATTRVYDTVEINTTFHSNAFAPVYAYFIADGLVAGEVTPEGTAASLTGTAPGSTTDERPGIVQSSADITFPVNLASLTLDFELVEDGVSGGLETYTFSLGPFATIGALVTALTGQISGVTVSNSGDRLVLSTTKTGANQSIAIKPTGTANTALGFSTVSETEDTGADVEFVVLASAVSEHISLPLVGVSATALQVDVSDSKGSHSVTVTPVDLSSAATLGDLIDAIAVAFGGTATTDRTLYDGGIAIATISSSSDAAAAGTVTISSLEGGTTVTLSLTATDGSDGFRHTGFYDAVGGLWAEVTGAVPGAFPIGTLNGKTLSVDFDDGGGPTTLTAVLGAPEAAAGSASALAALFNASAALTEVTGTREVWWIGNDLDDTITCRTVRGGASISLDVDASGGSAAADLGFVEATNDTDVGSASTGNADETGDDTLKDTTLGFYLDDNPYEFEATFITNSLQDAIDEVNLVVGGATDVASETSGNMTLTSLLLGAASKVEVNDASTGAIALGLSGSASGSGRPDPSFYLTDGGDVVIGPSILRNGTTGRPFSLESALSDIYLQYTALRLDVSASAVDANILTIGDVATLEDAIGPISTSNPLALGVFLALANAPSVDVSALGLDEANAAAPEGTIDAWARALELLESKEVYALAPLTGDAFVASLIDAHVKTMSLPTNRGERIGFIWTPNPLTAPDTVVMSGTDAETNGTDDSLTLETNPSSDLISAGISLSGTIPLSKRLFIEVLVVDAGTTELRRYSVKEVNGVLLTLRTTFSASENLDGFYSVTPLDGSAGYVGLDWSLKIRGEALLIAGTSRLDLNAVAQAAADQAEPYLSRRTYYLFGSSVETSVNGITQKVPLYYAAAGIAGQVAQLNPSQPFTRVPIAGLGRVYGTDDTFGENQMDTIADGGRYILVNQGGSAVSRHSRSTDPTTIENRELSITKAIDWMAKGLRATNRVFIGRYVVTQGFLDQLTMANQGFLSFAVQSSVVGGADLKNILQDESAPDTVLVDVEVDPLYPCNKIRVTIVA